MNNRVLITGGAGFIGSHLADELLARGYQVRVLDSLEPQVHGHLGKRPPYLDPQVELLRGDVRDPETVHRALDDVDMVCHLAAAVGVGQSMYQIRGYTSTNSIGTATLLEALITRPVARLVVASSMSVYGEGLYLDAAEHKYEDARRSYIQLREGRWDPEDATGAPLSPIPTPETKRPSLQSIYALTKYDQERMCLLAGQAYNVPTLALRFFNVYGPRQALSNPYTGVLAIFASRLLNDKPPIIFEDGLQQRDFVHVRDVAQAIRLALELPTVTEPVLNVASGAAVTIREVAERLTRVLGSRVSSDVSGEYRVGDIRHCIADIGLARRVLGFQPAVDFDQGLIELAEWLQTQVATDHVDQMRHELAQRGLTA